EQTHDPSLLRETFQAAEENRSDSLRLILDSRPPEDLPAGYWDAVAQLQRAEVAALQNPAAQPAAQSARAALMRLEAGSEASAVASPGDLLDRLTATLDRDTALLSFDIQDSASWLWAVDGQGIAMYRLPGRQKLASFLTRATAAIRG